MDDTTTPNIGFMLDPDSDMPLGFDESQWTISCGQEDIEDWLAGMFERPEGLKVLKTAQEIVRDSRT